MQCLDVEKMICALAAHPEGGCRGFTLPGATWPLHGLVVKVNGEVRGYLNARRRAIP